MKSVLVGVGQAGGKLTTALSTFDSQQGFGAVLDGVAINSARTDLSSLPIETHLIGGDVVKGHGVGGDNELGAQIMENELAEVTGVLDGKIPSAAEAIVVVAGLGGGTGSGGAPVLVRRLKQIYDVPVYALGVLPGADEPAMYQINAGRSLKTLLEVADSILLVDNDAWRSSGESVSEGFDAINRNIARRFGLLFAAGEITHGVGESVVDTSEIINTLRSGGISALGFAGAPAADDPAENITTVMSTTRNAVLTGTSLPGASTADAALLVVAGDPDRIPRKGVEKARRFIEDETGSMAVRGGDFPIQSDRIASLVLLGGLERSDRVDRFLARARQAAKEVESEPKIDRRTVFDNDEIDTLF